MTIGSGQQVTAADYTQMQLAMANQLGNYYYQGYVYRLESSGRAFGSKSLQTLADFINKSRRHQTGLDFTAAELPVPKSGAPVRASDLQVFQTRINQVLATPWVAASQNMTLNSSAAVVTRASTWGGGSSSITVEVEASWMSNLAMTAFFNTGGELRWNLSHSSVATTQDSSWNTLLSQVGTVLIYGGSSVVTGNPYKFPRSSLSSTYTTIRTVNSGTTAYTYNSVTISAKLNASNTGIVVRVILTDAHTNAFYDTVQSGTRITFSHLTSTVVMTDISPPSYTTITSF